MEMACAYAVILVVIVGILRAWTGIKKNLCLACAQCGPPRVLTCFSTAWHRSHHLHVRISRADVISTLSSSYKLIKTTIFFSQIHLSFNVPLKKFKELLYFNFFRKK